MFKWYRNAQLCLTCLADVDVDGDEQSFQKSEWFERGWTLQELLAPRVVVFVTKEWRAIGNKGSSFHSCDRTSLGHDLVGDIASKTGIVERVLHDWGTSGNLRAEDKMEWMEDRRTTREEDLLDALLGVVGVMPSANYGGGDKA
jgi:hypothetical protein